MHLYACQFLQIRPKNLSKCTAFNSSSNDHEKIDLLQSRFKKANASNDGKTNKKTEFSFANFRKNFEMNSNFNGSERNNKRKSNFSKPQTIDID